MQARVVFPDGAHCIAEEENLFEMDMHLEDSDTEQELYPGTVLKGERSTLKDVEWIHETKMNNHRMSSSKNVTVRIEEVKYIFTTKMTRASHEKGILNSNN